MKNPNTKSLNITLLAITPEPQKIIELAGRTCWHSFERISENSNEGFIAHLIKMGHESPLEHACATFHIENCSRAMTHQLVRHRLISVCQESQRYVEEDSFNYVVPPSIPTEHIDDYHEDMQTIAAMYGKWRQRGIKKEDARFVLPNACVSQMVITANFREWRHILKVRLAKAAQWEIREACSRILQILKSHAPECFNDF